VFGLSFVISFVISLVRHLSSWDRPGRMAEGSLRRAATVRTAAGKRFKKVRRHSLDRLHASMIKQKKKSHTGQCLNWTKNHHTAKCWCAGPRHGAHPKILPPLNGPAKNSTGGGLEAEREERGLFKIRDLLADARCSRAVVDILSTTDVGRWVTHASHG
jgi:hypothetical protein